MVMTPSLRPALESDFDFCESITRSNLAPYLAARGIAWERRRYLDSWERFETSVICCDDVCVGLLRLLEAEGVLEVRDLQLLAMHRGRGIGAWAIGQAKARAMGAGISELRLRVFSENPAQRLYSRLGFRVAAIDDGVIHMVAALPPVA